MLVLRDSDLKRLSHVAHALEQPVPAEEVQSAIVAALRELISAEGTGVNVVDQASMTSTTVSLPVGLETPQLAEVLARLLPEHPLLVHFLRTGATGTTRFSDLLTLGQLRQLQIYHEFYRPLGFDRFMSGVRPYRPGDREFLVAVSYGRARRDFTDTELRLADLVQPCWLAALRLADQRAWMAGAQLAIEHADDSPHGLVMLGPHGVVWLANAAAHALLAGYFRRGCRDGQTLPEELTAWLRAQHAPRPADGPARRRPYQVRRGHATLTVTYVPTATHGGLILTEHRPVAPADPPPVAGLTARQVQILRLAADGYTSTAIGHRLSISARTVEHHLANVYARLGARNRAEAAMLAFGPPH